MARFHFSLQQLMDLRSRAEDRARCELAQTQREACAQREHLDHLKRASAQAAQTVSLRPGQPVQPAMLLNNDLHLAQLRAKTVAQQARVEVASHREGLHRQQLVEAARNHEVLARLRQRRWEQFTTAHTQAETRALDEAATMAFIRQRENV
jgi:flagellar export protein FliJ